MTPMPIAVARMKPPGRGGIRHGTAAAVNSCGAFTRYPGSEAHGRR
jgi:hypothetical protein